MNMATLMMATIGTGISLAGLMIGLVAWLRADTRRMEDRLREDMRRMEDRWQTDMKVLREDMKQMEERWQAEIAAIRNEMAEIHEDINAHRKETAQLRERMAHLEGLLDGLREAIVARAAA